MGGAGIAFRSNLRINTMNPASYSVIAPNTALFSASLSNRNFYLDDPTTKSSFNTTNVRDIVFQLPIARRLGLAVSATPYSEIGYRVRRDDDNVLVGSDIGRVTYNYEGSGGLTQFKAGLGWGVTSRLSLGAEFVYYHGDINRLFSATITSITGTGVYNPVRGYTDEIVNTFLGNFGVQYSPIMNERTILTLGATYTMGGKMRGTIEKYIPSSDLLGDTIRYWSDISEMNLPHKVAMGAYLYTDKVVAGADWEYATWGNGNASNTVGEGIIAFRNTNSFRVGLQWTPNAGDIRNILRRWSYRIGYRFENYYMTINGKQINDHTITLGIGIPLGATRLNQLDIGFEIGQRGRMEMGILRERYIGFSVGFSFFGDDYWFVKRKYD